MFQSIGNNFPLILMCICCFVIIVPFSVLITFLLLKSRKEAWSGVILKKIYNQTEDSDDNVQDNYSFLVKMDDGSRNRNIAVSSKLFAEAKEGGKIKKDKGKLIPELINV